MAQATYVVDAAGGPGANYQQIQQAVSAVPSGSILSVRQGIYGDVDIDGKSLVILCDAGVSVSSGGSNFLRIRNTVPNQPVYVRGMQVAMLGRCLQIDNAAGLVALDGSGGYFIGCIQVSGSRQVYIRNYTVQAGPGVPAAAVAANSYAVFDSGSFLGNSVFLNTSAGLSIGGPVGDASGVQLSGWSVRGGDGYYQVAGGTPGNPIIHSMAGAPAVQLASGSELRVTGPIGLLLAAGGTPLQVPVVTPALTGGGSARIDPLVALAPTAGSGVSLTRPAMPRLVVGPGGLGGVTTVTRYGPANVLCVLAMGLPATPWFGQPDPIGIDSASLAVMAFGAPYGAPLSTFAAVLPIPNVPALRGFVYAVQGGEIDTVGTLSVTSPAFLVVP